MSSNSTISVLASDGSISTITIPVVASDLEPQYPDEWFSRHPGMKPGIILPEPVQNREVLRNRLGGLWGSGTTLEESLDFAVAYVKENFKIKLEEDWVSYNVKIGAKDEEVSPLNLLNVTLKPYIQSTTTGSRLEDKEITDRICGFFSIYRVFNASQAGTSNYQTEIINKLRNVFSQDPFNVQSLTTSPILTNVSWGSNENYRKLVAAIDMFFFKFRNHKFAKIRMATLTARNKDCGALAAVKDLASLLGKTTHDALCYALDPRIGKEMGRLSRGHDEMSKPDSYFHYFKEFCISLKSPYSSSLNSALYNLTYSIGTFLGDRRSCNARLFSSEGINNTINIAAYVAYYTGLTIEAAPIMGDADLLRKFKETQMPRDDDSDEPLYLAIYNQMLENKFKVTEEIRNSLRERLIKLDDLREGTLGKHIQTIF